MNICVYGKYRVKCVNRYDYITEYDYDCGGSPLFAKGTERFTKTESGSDVIERIKRELNNPQILSADFTDNKIHFQFFDPYNGTGQDIIYTLTEVHNGNGKRNKNTRKVNKNNP